MNETLNDTIRPVLTATDAVDAKRKLVCYQQEIHTFYGKTFCYPIEEEFAFGHLVYQFKQSAADERPLIVTQMEQMIQKLWYAKHDHVPSDGGKEFYAHSVFEEVMRLRRAVDEKDERMCGYCLDYLWGGDTDHDYFRHFLADLNDADLWKIELFESYLREIAWSLIYLSEVESGAYKAGNDFDQLGLDIAKRYLHDTVSEVRTPWLTDFILLLLFDVLILTAKISLKEAGLFVRFRARKDVALWLTNLLLFRNEIASRCYDSSEMTRRLRGFEDAKGTYVIPSLVYPLLELQVRK